MPMSIFVKTLMGLSFELYVSPTETIKSVKSKIQRTKGIPINQQHLVWRNCELDNHRRLRDYSISEGSTLCLVLSLRSGPLSEHRTPPLRLTATHPSKTTVPPFTSVPSSTSSSSFVYSNLLTSVIKPSILQLQNTENGERSDLISDKSKQSGAEWYEMDESNSDSVLPSDSALESQPDFSVDVRTESSSISSSVAQKAMDVSFTGAFQNSVNRDTPLNSGLRERNSNNIGQSPPNLEVVVGISSPNGNITETTYISERNRSLSSPEKETLNALTEQASVPIAVAVNNHSNVPESSNSSPFSPSVHHPESPSALNQENHPSLWVSCDTNHIPPPFHKQDWKSKTPTVSDFGEYKLNIERMYKENQVNGVGDLDNCSNTETTSSTTANILASLLAKVVPNRTSIRCRDRQHCPRHSRREFFPLPEESEEENSSTRFSFLDSEWFDKELDSIASSDFETNTDQDDDNPPIVSTGYQSYSFCNCGCNHSHPISYEALETAINSIVQAEAFVRLQECNELAEKVKRLKIQMKNVRLRKQNWYRNTQNTKYSIYKEETSAEDQYHDIANRGKNSEHVNEIAANSCDFSWTNSQINRNHLSNLHTSSLNCLKDASDFSNSGLRERNSNNIGQSPPNLEVVVGISSPNGNITETTYISERNRSLSSPEKETLNALTEQASVPIAVAVNNHSNVPESSNSSPFSPSVHHPESPSALNQENHPSLWVSCDTNHIPPPFHKQDWKSKTPTVSDFGEYKLNIERMYKENQVNGVGDLDNCSNTETTSSTTANILASLLAKVVPNRTSIRCRDRQHCPRHSRREFFPLPEESEEENSSTRFSFLDSEWFDKELDSIASSDFETNTDQDDDNPPIVSTGYQSYSFCNCGCNHSHPISYEALETAINSIVQAEAFVRLQECNELAEKVKRLKIQMKNVRLRKQNWYRNTQNTKYSIYKEETSAEDQYHDIANRGKNSEHVNEIAANSCDFSWTNSQINRNHLSNLHTSSLNCLKDASDFSKSPQTDTRGRIRQRRYATITPPDVNCLIRTADSQCRGSESTTNILPSLFYPECTSQSSEGSIFENSLSLRSPQHINQFSSPDKNLTTSLTTLSYNEPTLCSGSVSQTRQHSMNSLQVSKLTRLESSSRFSSDNNRSTPTKTSSSVPFLPKLGSSVSTGHLTTTIPLRLPSRGGSRLNTPAHFSKPNDCDGKLLNPIPPHYISTILIEASHLPSSPNSIGRKRCSMCSRKIGLTNSYTCRCDRSFCSVHRYAEVHACQYDYKAEARRYIIESNPVITTPKLPKI